MPWKFKPTVKLPSSGWSAETTLRASCVILLYRVHHQENIEQQWCTWLSGEEKGTALQNLHYCPSTVCAVHLFWVHIYFEANTEISGLNKKCFVCSRKNTAFQQNNIIPPVKHGGGSIMIYSKSVLLHLAQGGLLFIDGTLNSELHQNILKENVRTRVQNLRIIVM